MNFPELIVLQINDGTLFSYFICPLGKCIIHSKDVHKVRFFVFVISFYKQDRNDHFM